MKIKELLNLSVQILENTEEGCLKLDEQSGFMIIKSNSNTELSATFYEPVICLILQGAKEVVTGERNIIFGQGESLIVSHGAPVVSKIIKATLQNPYIALILRLNLDIIRGLYEEFADSALLMQNSKSIVADKTSSELIESLYRLLKTSQNKLDSIVLYSQILREVHYRILQDPYGGMLRGLLKVDSNASNISKAISIIRSQFNKTLSIPDIAKSVGMSTSSFHQHFKSITESTPLQYQKDLRLLEAKRLLTSEGYSVTEAALTVGYESPNQISREYTRKFFINPSKETKIL